MVALIIMLVFGLAVAIFALQNTILTTVNLFGYVYDLPLYFVIIGSMLVGILAASIIGIVNGIGNALALSHKDMQISSSKNRVSELERENESLKQAKNRITIEKDAKISAVEAEARANRPSLIESFKRNFKS